MKILITGGAGFIGSAVVRLGIKLGYKIITVDNLTYAGNLENLKTIFNHKNHVFEKADICNYKKIIKILNKYNPDSIMHLAASSHVDNSIKNPADFINVNVNGTYSLLEASKNYLKKNKKRNFVFQYISTDEVFGSISGKRKFTEGSKFKPNNPYAASKASGELLVRAWNKTYGLPTIVTNTSNNYGPYQFIEKLIPTTIICCLNNKNIPVYGNGKNIRDWIHVDDNANALFKILRKGKVGSTYNIGANNEISNINIVKKICKILDKKLDKEDSHLKLINFVNDRPGHDFKYAINFSKIKKEIGWKPKISFNSGLEKTVDWYIKNNSWVKKNLKKLPKI